MESAVTPELYVPKDQFGLPLGKPLIPAENIELGIATFVGRIEPDIEVWACDNPELDDHFDLGVVFGPDNSDTLTLSADEVIEFAKLRDPEDFFEWRDADLREGLAAQFQRALLLALEQNVISLTDYFTQQIKTEWRWDRVVADAKDNAEWDDDADAHVGRQFLATQLAFYPSGKIYAAWTSNQTEGDVLLDRMYVEAAEAVAEEHDGWLDYDNGDVCFCLTVAKTFRVDCTTPDGSKVVITSDRQDILDLAKRPHRRRDRDLWNAVDFHARRMSDVRWVWTKGHDDNPFNQRADALARAAARRVKP